MQYAEKKARIQKAIGVGIIALLVIILLVVIYLIYQKNDTAGVTTKEVYESVSYESASAEKWAEGVITYQGKQYLYNTGIRSFLFMGIDHDGVVEPAVDMLSGGQSDAMFLLVVDGTNEKTMIISINRNSMVEIDMFDYDQNYLGVATAQICLSHGYGDGKRMSCGFAVDAVSRMFDDIPIAGYVAMNMGGIIPMNDAIGGVTLTVLEGTNDLPTGETVTLSGQEAYHYLRDRDRDIFDSASLRLNRERQYLNAYIAQAKSFTGGSVDRAVAIYNSLEPYMVSSIDFAEVLESVYTYGYDPEGMLNVPGETVMGEKFEEYWLDEEALKQMIIEVFYNEVE